MTPRRVLWMSAAGVALLLAGFCAWLFSLPPSTNATTTSPPSEEEAAATLAALRPPKRERPLVAVVGINDATETTDYLMPAGILRRADIADVVLLATGPGPVKLYPALTVESDSTIAQFDASHQQGADYVIVPAMSRDDDPTVLAWLKSQRAKGAIIIGVCAGAKVVASSGLLDGKRATTHWYYLEEMLDRHPSILYVPNRRFVVDGNVMTTTGISASIPLSLTLIEAIAGREKAIVTARDLGIEGWDARHDSGAFMFTRPFALTVLGNVMSFWNREQLGIELSPALDEVSLALVADAWSRTYRSRAVTYASSAEPRESRNAVRILPELMASSWPAERRLSAIESAPADALNNALREIAARYGDDTARVVAMQLEYARPREAANESR